MICQDIKVKISITVNMKAQITCVASVFMSYVVAMYHKGCDLNYWFNVYYRWKICFSAYIVRSYVTILFEVQYINNYALFITLS